MAKLLPVARKRLRNPNFWKVTDITSDLLSIPIGRFKHRLYIIAIYGLSARYPLNFSIARRNKKIILEKWVAIVFVSHWKSRKPAVPLMPLTMFCWTEVYVIPKKVWEVFCANPRGGLACVILECFVNFLDDPYYNEPLPWFMI